MHTHKSVTEFIEGLAWYWQQKNRALAGVDSLTAENFAVGARLYYGEYFLYLVSAIDLVKDFDGDFPAFLQAGLDGFGAGGKNNYEYLRTLRHTIIHRGSDITSTGVGLADGPQPICPAGLWSKGQSYSRIVPFMRLYVWLCETVIGALIDSFLSEKGAWCARRLSLDGRERARRLVADVEHMPPQLKPAALQELEQNYGGEEIWQGHVSVLRQGLKAAQFSLEEIAEMVTAANVVWKQTCSFPEK